MSNMETIEQNNKPLRSILFAGPEIPIGMIFDPTSLYSLPVPHEGARYQQSTLLSPQQNLKVGLAQKVSQRDCNNGHSSLGIFHLSGGPESRRRSSQLTQ